MNDIFVSFIADGLVFILIIVSILSMLFYVPSATKLRKFKYVFVAGLTSYFIAKIFSIVYQPHSYRPFERMGIDAKASYLNNPGFPSDHSLFSWFLVFALFYVLPKNRRWVAWLCVSFAVFVCLGRLLAFVHTPLDVFGGFVAAIAGASWYLVTHLQKSTK